MGLWVIPGGLPVSYSATRSSYSGTLIQASANRLVIHAGVLFPIGTPLELRIKLPSAPVIVHGHIAQRVEQSSGKGEMTVVLDRAPASLRTFIDERRAGAGSDLRRNVRRQVSFEVTYLKGRVLYRERCSDLSIGGMFVRAREPARIGEHLTFELDVPGRASTLVLRGTIAHVVDSIMARMSGAMPGMGVTFDELKQQQRQVLTALLDRIR